MDRQVWRQHRWLNLAQSALLLVAMALAAAALGWVLAGPPGALWALLLSAIWSCSIRNSRPDWCCTSIAPSRCRRDRWPRYTSCCTGSRIAPVLYRVPTGMVNAFAVGTRHDSAVVVTDALLQSLSPRELVAVLTHELSHIRHGDLWVMGLADLFSQVAHVFATLGQLLLLLKAPVLNLLMQLALSRTREYDADLGAVELTGDPQVLAMALETMERYPSNLIEQVLMPGRRVPDPSLLRTHPHTADRIRRLQALTPARSPLKAPASVLPPGRARQAATRRPR